MLVEIEINTGTHTEWVDITDHVQEAITQSGIASGLCHVFVPHTTAGLTLNEGWDPAVSSDVLRTLERLIPWKQGYRHVEGNSAAHIKASLCGNSVTIPFQERRLLLGTWQRIFLAEFDGPRHRRILVKLLAG